MNKPNVRLIEMLGLEERKLLVADAYCVYYSCCFCKFEGSEASKDAFNIIYDN